MARTSGVEGVVEVQVGIRADGRVAFARGSGSNPILVAAAEANARQWVFNEFSPKSEFPMYRNITYVFKLKGDPVSVVTEPPDVRTDLPDHIEISAPPVRLHEWKVIR